MRTTTIRASLRDVERTLVVAVCLVVLVAVIGSVTVLPAVLSVLGDRVVGICDSPLGLAKRAANALAAAALAVLAYFVTRRG